MEKGGKVSTAINCACEPKYKSSLLVKACFLKHQADFIQYLGHSEEMHESVLKGEDPTLCILIPYLFGLLCFSREFFIFGQSIGHPQVVLNLYEFLSIAEQDILN